MSIEYLKYLFEIIHKYISQPKLVLYFESSESYHTRIVPSQNNTQSFFCHLMVKNTGRKTAKNCRARVIDIQAEDTTGSFVLCPGFLNPFILKWAHEDNFNPKDIEPDIPVRLDLCCGLQNRPNNLIFITQQKADGNQTIYPPGTYNVKVRVNAENSQTVDGEFVIQFGGSWNDIHVITDDNIETEHRKVNSGEPKKEKGGWGKKIGVGLFGLAAIATILAVLFGDNIWGRFNEKLKSKKPTTETTEMETKQIAESKLVLSLRNICRDIESRPSALQHETAKQYYGLSIKRECLKVLAVEVNPGDENIYNLHLTFPDQPTSLKIELTILCEVSRDQYPQLHIAKEGMELYLSGEIEYTFRRFVEDFIVLSNVTLEFE